MCARRDPLSLRAPLLVTEGPFAATVFWELQLEKIWIVGRGRNELELADDVLLREAGVGRAALKRARPFIRDALGKFLFDQRRPGASQGRRIW